MKLLSFALKSAFLTGALTAGAFITGTAIGMFVNKEKALDRFKKMQLKKINQHQRNSLILINVIPVYNNIGDCYE